MHHLADDESRFYRKARASGAVLQGIIVISNAGWGELSLHHDIDIEYC